MGAMQGEATRPEKRTNINAPSIKNLPTFLAPARLTPGRGILIEKSFYNLRFANI
jgi:hypothetical protein